MITRRSLTRAACALPLLSACSASPETGAVSTAPIWRRAPEAPYPTQEIYPALHNGGIWIAGGFSPQAPGFVTDRVIVFDLTTQTWRDGPRLPTPSHHVHLASAGGALWAIGGFIPQPRAVWTCTPRVLKLEGEAWVEGPALPRPIGEAVPVVHLNRIHLIGGRSPAGSANADWDDQADVADHFVLDPRASHWERAEPLPMARNSAGGASDGNVIHVVSGRTVAHGQTPAHHIYDPRTGRWSEGHTFPEPRGGVAAAFWNGQIVAGGGEIFEPGSVGNTLYAYDSASGWRRIETMPTPRHGHGFVVSNNELYALGGAERPSADGTLASVDALG